VGACPVSGYYKPFHESIEKPGFLSDSHTSHPAVKTRFLAHDGFFQ
jgi:hypothetical protein